MKKKVLITGFGVLVLILISIPVIMFNMHPRVFNIDANTIDSIKIQLSGVIPGTTPTVNITDKSEINKIVKDVNSLRYKIKIDSAYLAPGGGDFAVTFYDSAGNKLPYSFLHSTDSIYIATEKVMYYTVPNSTINYNYFANLTGDAQI